MSGESGDVEIVIPEASEKQFGELGVQLDQFLTDKGDDMRARRFLRSDDLDVYVRIGNRPYGVPRGGFVGIVGDRVIPANVRSLDIGDVDMKQGTTIEMDGDEVRDVKEGTDIRPWEDFISEATTIAHEHGIEIIYLDEIVDPAVLKWCKEKNLKTVQDFYPHKENTKGFIIWTEPEEQTSKPTTHHAITPPRVK